MILTCPECGTSYFVDDARIPSGGRSVKCSSCDARWMAMPEAPATPAPPPSAPKPAPPPTAFATDDPFVGDLEVIAPSDLSFPTKPARSARSRDKGRPKDKDKAKDKAKGGGKLVVLICAALAVAILVAGAIVFRDAVVKAFPQAQSAYAGVGLPADALGLVIENVQAQPTFEGGRPVLAVSGAIRNARVRRAVAPSLRVSLLDRAGKPVAVKIVKALDGAIPAGATRHFMVTIDDPPLSMSDLVVTFETTGAVPPLPTTPAPAAPAPSEPAKPAPAGAPAVPAKHD